MELDTSDILQPFDCQMSNIQHRDFSLTCGDALRLDWLFSYTIKKFGSRTADSAFQKHSFVSGSAYFVLYTMEWWSAAEL